MIVKEKSEFIAIDKLEKAGHEAELKVAYYLKMAFGNEPRLLILNDLRVEFEDGITAQMDHLLIHQYGLIIIESKSVAGRLQVYEDGQWVRWYRDVKSGKDRSSGMQNPVKQARLQGQTLRQVLLKSASNNTRKVLEQFPVDVLVSISDSGVFLPHDRALYPEVCKADQIEERIRSIVLLRAQNMKEGDFVLSETNKLMLAEHLNKMHRPYAQVPKGVIKSGSLAKAAQNIAEYISEKETKPAKAFTKTSTSSEAQPTHHACRKCKSPLLEIRYANNYFFKCLACDANSRIEAICASCKRLLKIRKDRDVFHAECSACKTSSIFHTNR